VNEQIINTTDKTLRQKMIDVQTPGFQVELTPEEAERLGAFEEDALSEQDAIESSDNLGNIRVSVIYVFEEKIT
jgi:hypothetical protein